MSTTQRARVKVNLEGDVDYGQEFPLTVTTTSPGMITVLTLEPGDTQVPLDLTGFTTAAVVIIPPSGNTNAITLKGTTTDTGIVLHLTDPSLIAVDTTQTDIYLTVASTTGGVRVLVI